MAAPTAAEAALAAVVATWGRGRDWCWCCLFPSGPCANCCGPLDGKIIDALIRDVWVLDGCFAVLIGVFLMDCGESVCTRAAVVVDVA